MATRLVVLVAVCVALAGSLMLPPPLHHVLPMPGCSRAGCVHPSGFFDGN